jgi:hypothetical protein
VLTLYLQDLVDGTNLSSAGCASSSFSRLFPSAGVGVTLDKLQKAVSYGPLEGPPVETPFDFVHDAGGDDEKIRTKAGQCYGNM